MERKKVLAAVRLLAAGLLLGACTPTMATAPTAPTPKAQAVKPMGEEEALAAIQALLEPFQKVDLDTLLASPQSLMCYSIRLAPDSLTVRRAQANKEKVREKMGPFFEKAFGKIHIEEIVDYRAVLGPGWGIIADLRKKEPLGFYIWNTDILVSTTMVYAGKPVAVDFHLVENLSWKEGPRYCGTRSEKLSIPDFGHNYLRFEHITWDFVERLKAVFRE